MYNRVCNSRNKKINKNCWDVVTHQGLKSMRDHAKGSKCALDLVTGDGQSTNVCGHVVDAQVFKMHNITSNKS